MARALNTLLGFRIIMAKVNETLIAVCGAAFFLYMFMVIADVTGRYAFLHPVRGTIEIGELVLAFSVFVSLAYVQQIGAHIRVTLLIGKLPQRWQTILEVIGLLIALAVLALITWQSFSVFERSWAIREVAAIDNPIPIYVGKFAYFLGSGLFGLQILIDLLCALFLKREAENGAAETASATVEAGSS